MYKVFINTQAAERAIKVLTESITVCGHKERDGFIKQSLKSRKKVQKFNVKKIQNLMNEELISVVFY